MTGGALGGGVLFAVLALLWIAVLAPSWIKKREFNIAEQNAARLQRTLRILAETAELPEEHRVEASAQQALAHERMLESARKRQLAERNTVLDDLRAEQLRAQQEELLARKRKEAAVKSLELHSKRMRKVRVAAFTVSLLGIVGVVTGAVLALLGLGGALLVWSGIGTIAGMGTLVVIAPGRAKANEAPAPVSKVETKPKLAPTTETRAPEPENSAAAYAEQQARAAKQRERARQLARAREAARQAATMPRENQPDSMLLREAAPAQAKSTDQAEAQPPAAAAPSAGSAPKVQAEQAARPTRGATRSNASDRLRNMGVVGDTSDGMPDLDAALRRRRNAG